MLAIDQRLDHHVLARRERITRSSRVHLLAQRIAAGEYRPDPDRLAAALVRRALVHRRVRDELLATRDRRVRA